MAECLEHFACTILAIIFFIKSKRAKKPIYGIRSTNFIRDFTSRSERLEIKYAREQISNLTATKVAFWNNGKATINGGDIAPANPLMIKVKDGYKILDASVLYTKEDANQFRIISSEDGSHVLIQFDYLDKGEGEVIQLLHTGKSSNDIEVCGTVKGAGKPENYFVPTEEMDPSNLWDWIMASLYLFFFWFMVYCTVRLWWKSIRRSSTSQTSFITRITSLRIDIFLCVA